MNYCAKSNDRKLLFITSESSNHVSGYFSYSSNTGRYISSSIVEKDKWNLMKKLFFMATQEIMKCYGENIEELTSEIWDKFNDSNHMIMSLKEKKLSNHISN